jgi:hypothetical protein
MIDWWWMNSSCVIESLAKNHRPLGRKLCVIMNKTGGSRNWNSHIFIWSIRIIRNILLSDKSDLLWRTMIASSI